VKNERLDCYAEKEDVDDCEIDKVLDVAFPCCGSIFLTVYKIEPNPAKGEVYKDDHINNPYHTFSFL